MFVALNEKDCFFFSFSFLWKLTGCVTSSYFSQTVWMRTGAVDEVILHINHAAEIQSATLHLRLIQIHAAVHHVYSFSALKLTLQLHVWFRWKTLQHNLLSRSLNYVSISKYQWIVKKKWKRLIFEEKLRCWEIHVLFFG